MNNSERLSVSQMLRICSHRFWNDVPTTATTLQWSNSRYDASTAILLNSQYAFLSLKSSIRYLLSLYVHLNNNNGVFCWDKNARAYTMWYWMILVCFVHSRCYNRNVSLQYSSILCYYFFVAYLICSSIHIVLCVISRVILHDPRKNATFSE